MHVRDREVLCKVCRNHAPAAASTMGICACGRETREGYVLNGRLAPEKIETDATLIIMLPDYRVAPARDDNVASLDRWT